MEAALPPGIYLGLRPLRPLLLPALLLSSGRTTAMIEFEAASGRPRPLQSKSAIKWRMALPAIAVEQWAFHR